MEPVGDGGNIIYMEPVRDGEIFIYMEPVGDDTISKKPFFSDKNRNTFYHGVFSIFLVAIVLTIFEIIFFYVVVIPGINKQRDKGLMRMSQEIGDMIHSFRISENNSQKNIDLNNSLETISKIIENSSLIDPSKKELLDTIENNLKSSENYSTEMELLELITNSNLDECYKKEINTIINNNKYIKIPENQPLLDTLEYRENLLREKINTYVLITGVIIVLILLYILVKIGRLIINDECYKEYKYNFVIAIIASIFTILILVFYQISFFYLGKQYLYTISGLTKCSDNNIENLIKIMKTKGEDYSEEEAFEYIFNKIITQNDKYDFDIEFTPENNKSCKCYGAKNHNDKCIKNFKMCHYLEKDKDKYGNGAEEIELLLFNKIKVQ